MQWKKNLKPFTFCIRNWQWSSRQLHQRFCFPSKFTICSSLQRSKWFFFLSFFHRARSLTFSHLSLCATESHSLILCALFQLQMHFNYFSAFVPRIQCEWVIKHCFCLTDRLEMSRCRHSFLSCSVVYLLFYQCEYGDFVCNFKNVDYYSACQMSILPEFMMRGVL